MSHQDLLTGGEVVLPVLEVGVPVAGPFGFCWIGPMLLVGLHLSLLLRQYVAVQAARETGTLEANYDPTFALTFPAIGAPRSLSRWKLRYLVKSSYLISLGLLPLAVLLIFQICFLPYHGRWVTRAHQVLSLLDLVAIWYFVGSMTTASLSLKRSFRIPGPKHRRRLPLALFHFVRRRPVKTLGAAGTFLLVYFVLCVAVIPGTSVEKWGREALWFSWLHPERNLSLEGATLVESAPVTELLVYELKRGDSQRLASPQETLLEAWRKHSRGLDLSGRDLRNADLSRSRLFGVKLSGADLRGARLVETHLEGADLSSGADVTRLDGADLRGIYLRRANLSGASLVGADLSDATGRDVILRGTVLLDARARGAEFDGADAAGVRLDGADLSGASLRSAALNDASLVGAVLVGADLTDAMLRSVELQGALLAASAASEADFSSAGTFGAVFRRAGLVGAVGLQTPGVDLNGAHLDGTDLGWERPNAPGPAPSLTDLRGVQGLALAPPLGSGPLLYDRVPASPGLSALPPAALPAMFFEGLSRELVRLACEQSSKPQLMESLLRRSVGCFGPRELLLERSLRRDLLEVARIEQREAEEDQGPRDPIARARTSCPVLFDSPEGLIETLEAVEEGRELRESGGAAFQAPYFLCGPGPILAREAREYPVRR